MQIGTDPLTDAELVHVTRSSATLTLASPSTTFTKAHDAGANVYLIVSAVDLNNKGSLDAAQTWAQAQTYQGQQLGPDGTLANPGWSFASDPDNGARRVTTNQWRLVAGGIDIATVSATGFTALQAFGINGPMKYPQRLMTAATYNFAAAGENTMQIVANATGTTINLPQITGSMAHYYLISDEYGYLGAGGDVTLVPWDDGYAFTNYDTINGVNSAVLNATNGLYILKSAIVTFDPLGSGGTPGFNWNLKQIA